jgi:uncharacterized protein YecT (DUF1311 family)
MSKFQFHRIPAFVLGTAFLFAPSLALSYIGENADGWDFAQEHAERCFEGNGQMAANVCMNETLKKYDDEMNAVYKSLSSALVDAKMLRDSQRAWLKFRDLECTLRSSGMDENGSGTQFVVNSCKLDLTIKRIKDLKHLDAGSYCNGCPVRK